MKRGLEKLVLTIVLSVSTGGCVAEPDGLGIDGTDTLEQAVESTSVWFATTDEYGETLHYYLPRQINLLVSSDADNDGFDDEIELSLAQAIAPVVLYDEDEGCGPATGWPRLDSFKVYPKEGITVEIHMGYFLDCQYDTAWSTPHLGDDESVRYVLHAVDGYPPLYRLAYAWYDHHGESLWVAGTRLSGDAKQTGQFRPIVAADQNSHGSWPGASPSSTNCYLPGEAVNLATQIFGVHDCFNGTMRQSVEDWDRRQSRLDFRAYQNRDIPGSAWCGDGHCGNVAVCEKYNCVDYELHLPNQHPSTAWTTCPSDCPGYPSVSGYVPDHYCGDGSCDYDEDPSECPEDCPFND